MALSISKKNITQLVSLSWWSITYLKKNSTQINRKQKFVNVKYFSLRYDSTITQKKFSL